VKKSRGFFVLLGLVLITTLAFAEVTITEHTGRISINGVVVAADEPLPTPIPDGAVIEVFSGSIEISGKAEVLVAGTKVTLDAGDSAIITLDKETGVVNITCLKGAIEVTKPTGEVVTLTEGESLTVEVPAELLEELASPS
jgi:hypothetical protein